MKYILTIIFGLLLSVGVHSQFVATTLSGGQGVGSVPSALLDSLFAYYSLDEPSGAALDLVGSNDLPLTGTVTQGVGGKVGDCYTFITDGYIGEIDTEFEFTGSFSLSCWVKTDEPDDVRYIISEFGAAVEGYTLFISSGRATANFRFNSGTIQLFGATDIDDDAWHHVVTSYEASDDSIKLWVDGDLDDIDHCPLGITYNANCRFTLGRRDGTGVSQLFWDGEIDEVAIYRGLELSHGKVDSLYNSGSGLAYPLDF